MEADRAASVALVAAILVTTIIIAVAMWFIYNAFVNMQQDMRRLSESLRHIHHVAQRFQTLAALGAADAPSTAPSVGGATGEQPSNLQALLFTALAGMQKRHR